MVGNPLGNMTFFLLFDVHIILNGYNASINYSLTLPLIGAHQFILYS
uniref:Uncharacterized protein n=2 Tax=Anguilla anguilla TaxID=7936 RepID=A0A0E9QG33_ANGAN